MERWAEMRDAESSYPSSSSELTDSILKLSGDRGRPSTSAADPSGTVAPSSLVWSPCRPCPAGSTTTALSSWVSAGGGAAAGGGGGGGGGGRGGGGAREG